MRSRAMIDLRKRRYNHRFAHLARLTTLSPFYPDRTCMHFYSNEHYCILAILSGSSSTFRISTDYTFAACATCDGLSIQDVL